MRTTDLSTACGATVGETDDFGFNSIKDPVSLHDLHATALHVLVIDHTKLTYKFQGTPFRLTDTEGKVVSQILSRAGSAL
jgi:hypothetical protein